MINQILQAVFYLQMLKQCVLSLATVEVLLNSYPHLPPCEWMDAVSAEIYEVSSPQC